ncbi:hypothetical protein Q2941_29855 [Bradyrhizobium sp. UFLA05-153]
MIEKPKQSCGPDGHPGDQSVCLREAGSLQRQLARGGEPELDNTWIAGAAVIHEVKHDGYGMLVIRVRLLSRNGSD